MINAVCGSGSTGRIVTDLCDELKVKGNSVKVAYGVGVANRIEDGDAIKISSKLGYYTHNALSRITDRAGFYSHAATQRLISAIEKFKPDVIHMHNLHGYYVNVKLLFQYLASQDIPIVWTLHDCWTMTGHCANFSYIHCDKWIAGCHHCPQLSAYPKCYLLDHSVKNYNEKKRLFTSVKQMTIVTPSEWLAEIVRKSFLSKYEVQIIPNGIDLNVFKPTPNDFRERHGIGEKKIVLAVSNVWNKKKGFYDVCKLSQMLDRDQFQVVMVGFTENQMVNIPDTVLPIRRTASVEELAGIYSAADVFINMTYEDNFPTVNLEALGCGTPVYTYRAGGSPESVTSLCGKTIPIGDIDTMCEAIQGCGIKSVLKCRERAMEYQKEIMFSRYIHLYADVIQNEHKFSY